MERHRVEAPWASTLPWTLRPLWPEGDLASPVGSWAAGPRGSRGKVGLFRYFDEKMAKGRGRVTYHCIPSRQQV